MPKKTKKRLLLIDGNALIHRAFHALPPLTTKKGELVNAVYGYTSTLLSVIKKFQPEYIAASFDLPKPTFRHKEYKEYKATREKAPDELYEQIPLVKEVTSTFQIPVFDKEGYEADDIIGTIAKKETDKDKDLEVIIVTGDADTLQLVDDQISVFTMRRGISDTVLYDERAVEKKYNLKPNQLADFKGLRGDPSDNIPGVKGVGEKTAAQLLGQFQTLEGVYEHIEEIKGATKEKLERDKMQAILSKKLGTIDTHASIDVDMESCKTKSYDRDSVVALFKELDFYSLIQRLPESDGKARQGEEGVQDFKYDVIEEKAIDEFVEKLKNDTELSIALNEDGKKYTEAKLFGIAFSWKEGRSAYVPYSKENMKKLLPILKNDNVAKYGYDVKRIVHILKRYGVTLLGIKSDVELQAYVLNSGGNVELQHLILEKLGEEREENKKQGQLQFGEENNDEQSKKTCQKADDVFKLQKRLAEDIEKISKEQNKEHTIQSVLDTIETPLIPILAQMEENGVLLDKQVFSGVSEALNKRIGALEKHIYKEAGEEFNINSTQQLSKILFEKLQLPADNIKKTKTGFSTASSELEKLREEHGIVEKIEEYRELFKLKTTYVDTLPELVDSQSRLHTVLQQAVTATGRLSSTDPNLQNIPIRTELGRLLRTAFVAPEGWRLVSADYSQIDLRAVAHLSQDKKLIEAFHRGEDIHAMTAAEINNVPPSQVTKEMRRQAKTLNFGVLYGMSAFGFSQAAGIDRDKAQQFIDAYMKRFSGVAKYVEKTKKFAREHEYVETLFGRRRYIPEINSPNFQVASGAERMAINMPIQGLAADIMKLSMIAAQNVVEEFEDDAKMVLQIHDELIFEIKEDKEEKFKKEIKETMENVFTLKVPLEVDVKAGDSWGEL